MPVQNILEVFLTTIPSAKNALRESVWTHCDLFSGASNPSRITFHSLNCKSKMSTKSSDKQSTEPMWKVQTQKELLGAMAFQELELHSIDDVEFDGIKNAIPEITHELRYGCLTFIFYQIFYDRMDLRLFYFHLTIYNLYSVKLGKCCICFECYIYSP